MIELDAIEAFADTMDARDYLSSAELQRDMSIGIELCQQYVDKLSELIEEIENG